jgi:hypothetical protein
MAISPLRIVLAFAPDDQTWLRHSKTTVPRFWDGHTTPPIAGDVLRIGGRQFLVQGRAWEHDGEGAVLRVFLSSSHAQSDTVFG